MICIEERTPTVAGDLGLFQSYRRSLLECSYLPGKDQKLSLRRKAVFIRAMNTDNFSPISVRGTEQTILIF